MCPIVLHGDEVDRLPVVVGEGPVPSHGRRPSRRRGDRGDALPRRAAGGHGTLPDTTDHDGAQNRGAHPEVSGEWTLKVLIAIMEDVQRRT